MREDLDHLLGWIYEGGFEPRGTIEISALDITYHGLDKERLNDRLICATTFFIHLTNEEEFLIHSDYKRLQDELQRLAYNRGYYKNIEEEDDE